jgi:hypothetical protein
MSFAYLFPDPFAFGLGVAAGLAVGMALAGLILLWRGPHPWLVVTRLQPGLYEQLRKAARKHNTSIGDEIASRLQGSFDR